MEHWEIQIISQVDCLQACKHPTLSAVLSRSWERGVYASGDGETFIKMMPCSLVSYKAEWQGQCLLKIKHVTNVRPGFKLKCQQTHRLLICAE